MDTNQDGGGDNHPVFPFYYSHSFCLPTSINPETPPFVFPCGVGPTFYSMIPLAGMYPNLLEIPSRPECFGPQVQARVLSPPPAWHVQEIPTPSPALSSSSVINRCPTIAEDDGKCVDVIIASPPDESLESRKPRRKKRGCRGGTRRKTHRSGEQQSNTHAEDPHQRPGHCEGHMSSASARRAFKMLTPPADRGTEDTATGMTAARATLGYGRPGSPPPPSLLTSTHQPVYHGFDLPISGATRTISATPADTRDSPDPAAAAAEAEMLQLVDAADVEMDALRSSQTEPPKESAGENESENSAAKEPVKLDVHTELARLTEAVTYGDFKEKYLVKPPTEWLRRMVLDVRVFRSKLIDQLQETPQPASGRGGKTAAAANAKAPTRAEIAKDYFQFLDSLEKRLAASPLLLTPSSPPDLPESPTSMDGVRSESEVCESVYEAVEKFVFMKCRKEFPNDPEIDKQDELLARRLSALQWVDPVKHKGIRPSVLQSKRFSGACTYLGHVNKYVAPKDKINCMYNCLLMLSQALTEGQNLMSSSTSEDECGSSPRRKAPSEDSLAGSDDILPLLIYTLIKVQLPNIRANLACIETFRHPRRLVGADQYCVCFFEQAVTFIESLGPLNFDGLLLVESGEELVQRCNACSKQNGTPAVFTGSFQERMSEVVGGLVGNITWKFEGTSDAGELKVSDVGPLFKEYKQLLSALRRVQTELGVHSDLLDSKIAAEEQQSP